MDYFPGCSSFGQYDIVRVTAVNVTFYFNYFCISKPSIIYPRRNNYCSMRLSAEETKKRTRVYNKLMIINAIDDDISNKNYLTKKNYNFIVEGFK